MSVVVGKAEAVRERLTTLRRAAGGGADIHAIGQIVQALGVRFRAGAEADDADRDPAHRGTPPARVTRSAPD